MSRNEQHKLSFAESLLPLIFTLAGMLVVIYSVPGQGKSGYTALGISLALIGVGIARARKIKKYNNG